MPRQIKLSRINRIPCHAGWPAYARPACELLLRCSSDSKLIHWAVWDSRLRSETPPDFALGLLIDSRDGEGVEGTGAPIEKQQIGTGGLVVARVDSFIFAVVHPVAVEEGRHQRRLRRASQRVRRRFSAPIHRHPSEGPLVRTAR